MTRAAPTGQNQNQKTMAIFHLSAKAVSRSAGRSATGAAAYRAGEKIIDKRTGEIHDYTRKGGVVDTELVMPDGSTWMPDRAELWNTAELAEKRKDACVAREFEVALPAELSPAERKRLAVDFARELANGRGCAVDVAIHAPGKGGDTRNHHAHILCTTRKVDGQGLGAKLDTEKAGRDRKADLEAVRERWATLTNERLRQNGEDVRIDHRSLEAQGIDREPTTKHLGPAATGYERRTKRDSRRTEWMKEQAAAAAAQKVAQAQEFAQVQAEIQVAQVEEAELIQAEVKQRRIDEATQKQVDSVMLVYREQRLVARLDQAKAAVFDPEKKLASLPEVQRARRSVVVAQRGVQEAGNDYYRHQDVADQAQKEARLARKSLQSWHKGHTLMSWWHHHVRPLASVAQLEHSVSITASEASQAKRDLGLAEKNLGTHRVKLTEAERAERLLVAKLAPQLEREALQRLDQVRQIEAELYRLHQVDAPNPKEITEDTRAADQAPPRPRNRA